jgi:hypothetical protein
MGMVSHVKNKVTAKFAHLQTIHVCMATINIDINWNTLFLQTVLIIDSVLPLNTMFNVILVWMFMFNPFHITTGNSNR